MKHSICTICIKSGAIPFSIIVILILASEVSAGIIKHAPPLPPPNNKVVKVSNAYELEKAVNRLKSNTTILIKPGEYRLRRSLVFDNVRNVALRGATGNRRDVVIRGKGMRERNHGGVPNIISVFSVENMLIADLTVADAWNHNIHLAGSRGPVRTHIYNVHFRDSGEQMLKVNPGYKNISYPDHGIVEYCLFEYSDRAKHWYTNGVDVLAGDGWIVRDNVFKRIRGPEGEMCGPAVLFFSNSKRTIVERNLFINCDVGIACGIFHITKKPRDGKRKYAHQDAIIRNNMIFRNKKGGDAGIVVGYSKNFKIYHNTIILNSTAPHTILYGDNISNGEIMYNLTDGAFQAVDDLNAIDPWSPKAHGQRNHLQSKILNLEPRVKLKGNINKVENSWFVDSENGDLHLVKSAYQVINKAKHIEDVKKDFDNQKRPRSLAPDIGADEY
jgi:hypothetical protein